VCGNIIVVYLAPFNKLPPVYYNAVNHIKVAFKNREKGAAALYQGRTLYRKGSVCSLKV